MNPWWETERLRLRPVAAADAPQIAKWKNDPLIRHLATGSGPLTTPDEQRADTCQSTESGRETYIMITSRGDDLPVGYVRLNWIDTEQRSVWLRIVLGERRAQGLGTEALRSLFERLIAAGLHRADAETYASDVLT